MNKIAAIIVVLVLVLAGFFIFRSETSAPVDLEQSVENAGQQGINVGEPNPSAPAGEVKEFSVDAANFSFTPKTMTVKEGDTVRITLNNREGMHDFKIDEFGAATKVLKAGETETIEFVANKKGSFEYYCSVGQHRQMGMVGTLVVE